MRIRLPTDLTLLLMRVHIARAKQHDPFFPEESAGALALFEHRAVPLQLCMLCG